MRYLIVLLLLLGVCSGAVSDTNTLSEPYPPTNINFKSVIIDNGHAKKYVLYIEPLKETVVSHVWWETGNYTSNIVAKLVAEDIASVKHNLARVDTNNLNNTTRRWITRKYHWSMTNQVHWMKCHVAPSNSPSIEVTMYSQYGHLNLYWTESLTNPKWIRLFNTSSKYQGMRRFKILMHPNSDVTKKLLAGKSGFFTQNPNPMSNRFYYIAKLDMTGLWPTVKILDAPARAELFMEPAPDYGPPPIPGQDVIVEKYWLNTNSGTRHNSECRYFENTASGEYCDKDEGTACKTCGG